MACTAAFAGARTAAGPAAARSVNPQLRLAKLAAEHGFRLDADGPLRILLVGQPAAAAPPPYDQRRACSQRGCSSSSPHYNACKAGAAAPLRQLLTHTTATAARGPSCGTRACTGEHRLCHTKGAVLALVWRSTGPGGQPGLWPPLHLHCASTGRCGAPPAMAPALRPPLPASSLLSFPSAGLGGGPFLLPGQLVLSGTTLAPFFTYVTAFWMSKPSDMFSAGPGPPLNMVKVFAAQEQQASRRYVCS